MFVALSYHTRCVTMKMLVFDSRVLASSTVARKLLQI